MILKIRSILKQYWIFYFTGCLLLFGMKLFYNQVDASKLRFLLAPTTYLVSTFGGIPFYWESHAGYVNHTIRFIIAPSCSGMQFMMIAFATLLFSFVHRMQTKKKGFCWFAISLIFSYFFTILINAFRIILSIFLPVFLEKTGILYQVISPDTLHTLIGTVVYFTSLLTLYYIAEHCISSNKHNTIRFSSHISRIRLLHFLPPIFWYFALVLGVPFFTRSLRNDFYGFSEYAQSVIIICLVVTGIFSVIYLIFSRTGHTKNS